MLKAHVNKEICGKCGGKCCKKYPGAYLPNDVFRIFGSIDNALKNPDIVIDCYSEGKELYYLRPATKRKLEIPYECIFLSETGCILPDTKKPSMCLFLEPSINGCHCEGIKHDKLYAGLKWKKFNLEQYLKSGEN